MRLARTVVVFVLLSWVTLGLLACSSGGGEGGLGDCPPGSQSKAQNGQFVLFGTCAGCHSSQLEGEARGGAPDGLDFDRPEIIAAMAEDIYATAHAGTMPPPTSDVPRLSDAQIEALRVYLACGAGQ
jgi:mono/diheme cytochrome c family protein